MQGPVRVRRSIGQKLASRAEVTSCGERAERGAKSDGGVVLVGGNHAQQMPALQERNVRIDIRWDGEIEISCFGRFCF